MILTHLVLLNLLGGASSDLTPPPPVISGFTDVNDTGRKRKPYRSIYAIQEKANEEYRAILKALPKITEEVAEEVAVIESAKVDSPKVDTSLIPPPPKFPPVETAGIAYTAPPVEESIPAADELESLAEQKAESVAPQASEVIEAISQAPIQDALAAVQPAETVQPHDEADDLEAIQAILHSLGLA